MSDLSMLRGVYVDTETYDTLVDLVLKRMERNESCPDARKTAHRRNDQGFESQSADAEVLRLESVLQSETGGLMTGLDQLGARFLNGQADT